MQLTMRALSIASALLLTACPSPTGSPGPQGEKGDRGDPGPMGQTGPLGPQGVPGPEGAVGAPGTQGPAGPQGVQGAPGMVVVVDGGTVVGPPGFSVLVTPVAAGGTPCPTGGVRLTQLSDGGISHVCNGATGLVGPTGPAGVQGNPGATGAQGPQGPQGPQGIPGLAGPQGGSVTATTLAMMSPQCATGGVLLTLPDAGTTAVCNGAQGSAGPQGIQGATGATGGVGPTGLQGTQGPMGATGGVGPAGPAGVAGPQGPTGSSGPPGQVLFLDGGTIATDWVQFAGFTAASYTGDLGGIVGANQKCRAAFAGSFFCAASDYYRSEPEVGAPGAGAWVDYERSDMGVRDASPCNLNGAWTNGTSSDWANNLTTTGGISGPSCNNLRALACCRAPVKRVFRGFTAATYTGNLGGITGANQKCRAEFPGSFFCTAGDYYLAEPGTGAPGLGAWVDYERSANGVRDASPCNLSGAWTNGTSSDWANNITPTGGISGPSCNNLRALACCQGP